LKDHDHFNLGGIMKAGAAFPADRTVQLIGPPEPVTAGVPIPAEETANRSAKGNPQKKMTRPCPSTKFSTFWISI